VTGASLTTPGGYRSHVSRIGCRPRRTVSPVGRTEADTADDLLEQLQKLGELKEAGVLTESEFQAQKAKILAG